jgi:biotin synthase
VDSVAVNILNPIPGTPLENVPPLSPLEVLKTIAVWRLLMPAVDIRTCGGRERALNGLQPMMFVAGASGTMTGDYLTTAGREPGADRGDALDLGLSLRGL